MPGMETKDESIEDLRPRRAWRGRAQLPDAHERRGKIACGEELYAAVVVEVGEEDPVDREAEGAEVWCLF